MRKGIKILGKVFSVAVLLLIILPMVLSLLLDIPAVQNYVVQKAVRMVSRKLETTVSIDRVDIGLFSKVKVKGFYVEDYQRDTLLYVGSLDAYITGLGIFGGGVVLSRGEIGGAKLYLRETPEGEMNIKQIVNRISDPDKPRKGNFRLSLRKASIEGMDLCLERLTRRDPEFGIDFSHMHLYGISARVGDFTIDGQSIYTTIEAMSARERSGFVLDHFSGRFYLTNGALGFEDTSVVTPRSNVDIPYISLVGDSWAGYKDFLGEVRIDGKLRNSTVSTDDIAYFAPRLRGWHTVFSNIDIDVAGVVSDFTGKVRSLQVGQGTWFTADAAVRGLPDIRTTHFDLTIPRLTSTAESIDALAAGIGGRALSDKLVAILGNSGDIDVNARFRGLLSSFDMRVGAKTDVGGIDCNLQMSPLRGGRSSVRGDVAARNLRLGELLGRRDLLGNATLTAFVDGVVGRGVTDANVVGNVTQLGFNGYVYDSLRLDGRLRNREFDGRITARDPNLDFDFLGMVDFNDSVPRYDFTMDLRRADLARLHVNRRDSVSELSAHIVAKAGGRSLDDLNGRIQVTDVLYRYNDKQLTSKSMTVTGENSARSKLVELRSDFADATFRSKTSYREVFRYLRASAWKYLPLLRHGDEESGPRASGMAVANDFSLLSVDVRHIDPIADAISPGLQVADGSSLQLLFNPASDQLSLKATSEYIERKRMLATRLNVNASNRGDSLTVYASAEDLYAGMLHLPGLSLTGGAKQGRVQLSAGFNDTLRKVSGLVGVRADVVDEHGPNGRVVDLRILPSHITRGSKTWQIFAHKIQLDTAQVVIDKFFVMNREQELLLDGIASRSREDSVTLRLRNFDLAPFTQVIERMGYVFEGRTNGSATMKSALHAGEITADILLDSLQVNDIPAPPLRLTSRWDFLRNRAGVTVTDRHKRDTLVRGFYAPSQVRYYARLDVDSLDMGLLDPILTGVISDTRGARLRRPGAPGAAPRGRPHGRNPRHGAVDARRFHTGALHHAPGGAERQGQPLPGFERPDIRSRGQRGALRHRPEPATPLEHRLRRTRRTPADDGAQHHPAGQRLFLRQGLRHGLRPHFGRQGAREDGYRRHDRRPFVVLHAVVQQVQYIERRLRDLQGTGQGRYGRQPRPQEDDVRTQAAAEVRCRQPDGYLAGTERAAGRRGRTHRLGQHAPGARRRYAQPADQPPFQRLRDVRRLYHHRGELPLLAAEHHQQEVRHRGWLHNPVDGLADGCHAQHQRHLQAQGVVAAPVAGYVRQPRG